MFAWGVRACPDIRASSAPASTWQSNDEAVALRAALPASSSCKVAARSRTRCAWTARRARCCAGSKRFSCCSACTRHSATHAGQARALCLRSSLPARVSASRLQQHSPIAATAGPPLGAGCTPAFAVERALAIPAALPMPEARTAAQASARLDTASRPTPIARSCGTRRA